MPYQLEQADLLRSRLNASYTEAKEALEACEGDVVSALAYIEQQRAAREAGSSQALSRLLEQVGRIPLNGGVSKLILKLEGQTLGEWPTNLNGLAAGVVMLLALLLSRCTIELEPAAPSQS